MCGFVGYINRNKSNDDSRLIRSMTNTLNHRGPDDNGYWYNEDKGVYIAHQRLSILELSKLGNQPMISCSGNLVII